MYNFKEHIGIDLLDQIISLECMSALNDYKVDLSKPLVQLHGSGFRWMQVMTFYTNKGPVAHLYAWFDEKTKEVIDMVTYTHFSHGYGLLIAKGLNVDTVRELNIVLNGES